MRWLLAVLLLLVSPAAHAMGTSVSLTFVAWNTDGSAALLARHTSTDGDTTDRYSIVGEGTSTSALVSIVGWVDDTSSYGQAVDRTSCLDAIQALQTALSSRGFRDVWAHTERCRQRDRAGIITVGAAAQRRVSRSRVAPPAALGLQASADADGAGLDAYAATGPLIVVLLTAGGGSPERMVGMLFVKAKRTYKRLDDA